MKKQVVVRTYPEGWSNKTSRLQDYLNQGYIVVLVNKIIGNKCENLEYILEKEVEEKENMN